MTMTVAITIPVVTQVISSTVEPSAPRRCGVATATIDVSNAPISVPNVTDRVTSHLLTGLRAAATTGAKGTTAALTRGLLSGTDRTIRRRPPAGRPAPRAWHRGWPATAPCPSGTWAPSLRYRHEAN